ncbi:hypothetical protein Y032_0071g570 [Ancylostoma ceylanicum]|uniref:Uncharacterized protein n=1 Tax=Ancylostoma ceylanicum TaxID=53326 RepID=A0A016TY53_9BILA|nr:hypothetical protein Y032_0071g570 [Ancylostoma ceylanicum]
MKEPELTEANDWTTTHKRSIYRFLALNRRVAQISERLSTHLLELISCERTTPICLRTTTTRLTDCRFSLFSE